MTKLALAAAIIAATFLANTYAALVGLLVLTLLLAAYAGVFGRLARLLKLLVPIALIMLVLQLVFVRGGDTLFAFVTDEGLITGGKACLRLLGVALPARAHAHGHQAHRPRQRLRREAAHPL